MLNEEFLLQWCEQPLVSSLILVLFFIRKTVTKYCRYIKIFFSKILHKVCNVLIYCVLV